MLQSLPLENSTCQCVFLAFGKSLYAIVSGTIRIDAVSQPNLLHLSFTLLRCKEMFLQEIGTVCARALERQTRHTQLQQRSIATVLLDEGGLPGVSSAIKIPTLPDCMRVL